MLCGDMMYACSKSITIHVWKFMSSLRISSDMFHVPVFSFCSSGDSLGSSVEALLHQSLHLDFAQILLVDLCVMIHQNCMGIWLGCWLYLLFQHTLAIAQCVVSKEHLISFVLCTTKDFYYCSRLLHLNSFLS